MKRLHLAVAALTLITIGCAHGKMGKVEQEMQTGSMDKSTPIFVEPITTKDVYISGDKSGNKDKMDSTKAKITEQFNRQLVEALNKKGFNAKLASGPVKSGVVLSGNVSKIENGSAAARYFVGMGAGSANMFTDFVLEDRAKSKVLSKFQIIATSGGESNWGGYLDKHMADGSKKTAEYLDNALNPNPKK